MIKTEDRIKRYNSAHNRHLKPVIVDFFAKELEGFFGPVVRENISDALIKLFEDNCPEIKRVKHGQIVWNALDAKTRGDSPKRRYKSVILTIVSDQEISMFEKGSSINSIRKEVIARIIKEAYQQGGILSMRDIGLIMMIHPTQASKQRISYEKENKVVLPHTGALHDMGSTITHKNQIIYKYIVEKKDPTKVANETNHSQKAVDRYIKDFYRIKTLLDEQKDLEYINLVTNIAKSVIIQYQKIIEDYVKEEKKICIVK